MNPINTRTVFSAQTVVKNTTETANSANAVVTAVLAYQ